MKTVKYVIYLIIVPLCALIFITVGLISAGISALIEYSVLQQFFSSTYQELISSAAVALLLVFSFEFTKVFLHFYRKKLQQKGQPISKGTSALVGVLVSFSFACSIIFTVTTLYLPTYDSETITAEIRAIEIQLEKDISDMETKYNDEYTRQMEPFLTAVQKANDALKNPHTEGMGPKTITAYLEQLRKNAEDANARYLEADKQYSQARDKKIDAEKKNLQAKADARIANLQNTSMPEIASQYDNPVISHFLTVLATILFQASNYSRQAYLWLCVLLGIVVAALLEAIISSSLEFLSSPMELLTEDLGNISEKLKHWCNEMVITLFKAFCAVTVYIIILSLYSASLEKEKICIGLFSCALSIFLIHKFVPTPDCSVAKEQIFYQVRDCILQGVVSLMGYVLLGFVFGNDVLSLDVNTVAVGFGSAISGGMIQLPRFLLQAGNKTDSHE